MAGAGTGRAGSGRSRGGSIKPATRTGQTAVQRQATRSDRLGRLINKAWDQEDRLIRRRDNASAGSSAAQALASRITTTGRRRNRLEGEYERLRQQNLRRTQRLLRRRGINNPAMPPNWPTGRQLWPGNRFTG